MVNANWNWVREAGCNVLYQAERYLFPPTCVLCTAHGQPPCLDLCLGCCGDLPTNEHACQRCAEPLHSSANGALCGACLRRPPRYVASYCAYRYGFPIDHLVRGLKYRQQLANARVLGELTARHLRRVHAEPWPQCIIPVPLAEARFRERGFNQAIEIGRELQTQLAIPLQTDLIARIRDTPEQAGLDRKQRRKNLRNAFKPLKPLDVQRVAILDDVVTTGSTVNELARVLLRAGVEHVEVWAVTRVGH